MKCPDVWEIDAKACVSATTGWVKCVLIKIISVDTLSYKTVSPNAENVERNWVVVDAEGQHFGRLCSKVAKILRGKNNLTTLLSLSVVIMWSSSMPIKVVLTGKKND